ncbi:MAG: trigger factor [candidate division KSB1 bacterium]|nr:trigger factor [candidate division KSB1 bacterium]
MAASYQVQIKELEGNRRQLDITFSPELVQVRLDENLARLQKSVKIPGFRPGRVPMDVVRRMFQKEVVQDLALDLVSEFMPEIGRENNLDIIGKARLKQHTYQPGEGLRVQVEVEVLPEIRLPDLGQIRVERPVIRVTDEDVDIELRRLQLRAAIELEVEDGAREGDVIIGQLKELDPTGLPLVGRTPQRVAISLPASENLREDDRDLLERLRGAKPGETRRFSLSRPVLQGSGAAEVSRYAYSLEVEKVVRREIPPLDDDFAKDIGDFGSLEELRRSVRGELEWRAARLSEQEFFDNIREELLKRVDFVPPESMVRAALDSLIRQYRERNPQARIPDADLERELRPEAVRLAKWITLRDKIVAENGLAVSEDDVDTYLEDMIRSNPEAAEQIRRDYSAEDRRSDLRFDLETERLYRFLASRVKAEEVSKRYFVDRRVQVGEPGERTLIRSPHEVA